MLNYYRKEKASIKTPEIKKGGNDNGQSNAGKQSRSGGRRR